MLQIDGQGVGQSDPKDLGMSGQAESGGRVRNREIDEMCGDAARTRVVSRRLESVASDLVLRRFNGAGDGVVGR
jgi:hypothetical protein